MPHRIGRVLWGLAIGAIAALALPSAASAKTVCTVGVIPAGPMTPTMSIEHSDDPGDDGIVTITIRRVQASLVLFEDATKVTCSGSPTLVTEVDRIL